MTITKQPTPEDYMRIAATTVTERYRMEVEENEGKKSFQIASLVTYTTSSGVEVPIAYGRNVKPDVSGGASPCKLICCYFSSSTPTNIFTIFVFAIYL